MASIGENGAIFCCFWFGVPCLAWTASGVLFWKGRGRIAWCFTLVGLIPILFLAVMLFVSRDVPERIQYDDRSEEAPAEPLSFSRMREKVVSVPLIVKS